MSEAAPLDVSKGVTILARRAMYRAGRKWEAGATDLSAKDAGELGGEKLAAIARDPNFTLAAIGTKAVTMVGIAVAKTPVDAHTLVTARRTMYRAGRKWQAGANPLTAKEVEELGPAKIAALKADPNFTVVQNTAAAAHQANAEAELAKKAAAEAEAAKKAAAAAAAEPAKA